MAYFIISIFSFL